MDCKIKLKTLKY